MAYRVEKNGDTEDIIWDGFENGIAPSPHKGIANIQAGNISSELGEVTTAFTRTPNYIVTPTITGGTLTASGGAGSTLLAAPSNLYPGMWINITSTTITKTTESVNYFVVGGGGGGGSSTGGNGGGGGGQVVPSQAVTLTLNTGMPVVVGAGGAAHTVGSSSSFSTTTAVGGGRGGSFNEDGGAGASGGGAGGNVHTGGAATAGSAGGSTGGTQGAAGGGGAGTVGGNDSGSNGKIAGNGGNGVASSISGASVVYGGGGGGSTTIAPGSGGVSGTGGTGGGGAGGSFNSSSDGVAGTANLGGGGGGNSGLGGSGVVIISYPTANLTATGGTITTSGSNTVHTFTTSGTFTVTAIATTIATGNYYVSYRNGSSQVKISTVYDPTVSYSLTHGTTGTATFNTVVTVLGNPLAKAVEKYSDGTAVQYRYYVLDSNSIVWVYDTGIFATTLASSGVGTTWVAPDLSVYTSLKGMEILNGWLLVDNDSSVYAKPTSDLGRAFVSLPGGGMMNPFSGTPRYMYTGHQGRTYYTDGNYLGSIFPDTSLVSSSANIQSYSSYTASGTDGTITVLSSGSIPFDPSGIRVPAAFFTDQGGTMPTTLTAGTVYYIGNTSGGTTAFRVYAALSGGSALNIQTGAVGNQFFNTFYPISSDAGSGGAHALVTLTQQRLNLPTFEISQTIAEIGNTVLVGCKGNIIYPWNQTDVTPSNIIALPEGNVLSILTVNQMAYMFAGDQGNVYITDGSVASLVINVPDYVAGVPGSPGTYIESTYTWGGVMYLRGRVYFSILDQSTTKAGNCGGIWSFVPTQNLYIGQDTGLALRLEAQNSYNTYNGYALLLIRNEVQSGKFPLYWSAWNSSITSPTYGIDTSNGGTDANFPCVIELDAVPVGTALNQRTPQQIEYKLGAPLDVGATVTSQYRLNITDAWTSGNTFITDSSKLSGYAPVNFQKAQWVQLRFTLTPITSTADSNSFIRFREARLR